MSSLRKKAKRFLLLCSLACFACVSSCKKPTPTLSLLVWEGYADPSFIAGFEATCSCKVTAAYMGSSDELVAKLRGGAASNYDVISPSSDVATMLNRAGLVAPLDLAKVPNYPLVSPKLTAMSLVKKDGQTYGVPLTWGPNPLLYDKTAFAANAALTRTPTAWADLWDPRYKDKLSLWDDLSSVYMAAQVLGFGKQDPTAIYNLNDAQLAQVKQKLLELKPNIRKLWSTGGELTNLFQNHEVIAAMGWPLVTNQLRKAGIVVEEEIPVEGTTGWIDHLMITSASDNKDLAYSFLNYMITAKVQKQLSDVTGYIPSNPQAAALMTADQRHSLHLDNIDAYQKQIIFWQDVPRRAQYSEIWNEVKAAP